MLYKNYFHNKLVCFKFFGSPKNVGRQLFSLAHLSTATGAIATSLLFSQSVMAQSFAGYCITQKGEPNLEPTAQKTALKRKSIFDPKVTVTKNARSYTISVDDNNRKQLLLEEAGKKSSVDQMTLAPEGGQINDLALGENGWLWIDRSAIDYVMKIDFSQESPSFDSPIKLPELSAKPCHIFRRILNKCYSGDYNYSPVLNSVFVSGYQKKSWVKHNYVHFQFTNGEKKPLPEILEEATFVADVPKWNGALFIKPSGEALFYDGSKIIDLSQNFLQLEDGANFQNWDLKETTGGRSFLGKFNNRTSKDPLFLMELSAKPGLKPIHLPKDFQENWFEVFTFAEDPELVLWLITPKVIFAQVDRKVKSVVHLPSLSLIERFTPDRLNSIHQDNNNVIPLSIEKEETKSISNYFLKTISSQANCEIKLDFEKPITLK